jgi:DNA-binding SARP family transcriptional activator
VEITLEIACKRGYKDGVEEFRVLGPLEVLAENGEPLVLGGQKQRAVLAVLLLQANHAVSTQFLIDALWGESPPRTATTSLHNAISALRKILGPSRLVTQPPGYKLVVPPEAIDLGRFEELVASAHLLEPAPRAEQLREALALWRGEPLAEIADEPFAVPEIRRLEELRLRAVEARIDADLDCERAVELVPELERLVATYPLRERLRGQLMLALYHAGRQAEALEAYQDVRRVLRDELGLEPGPQLQQLYASILRQEIALPASALTSSSAEHVEEVGELLLGGKVVPVLGCDISELASRLATRFEYPAGEATDLTRIAQYVALTKGAGPLYDELHAMLAEDARPTAVHRFFASLPPLLRDRGVPHQLLVTTSYDLALEQALLEAGEEFDVVSYLAAGRHRGRFCHVRPDGTTTIVDLPNTYATELSLDRRTIVLKLHGGLDASASRELESFVVTEDDYIDYLAYSEIGSAIPVALAARLRRSHFLFLGYGMRDWNRRLVLGRMWGGEGVAYRSWAVQPGPKPLERQFWRARDIDLLDIPLDDYLGALGRYLGLATEAAA